MRRSGPVRAEGAPRIAAIATVAAVVGAAAAASNQRVPSALTRTHPVSGRSSLPPGPHVTVAPRHQRTRHHPKPARMQREHTERRREG
jgi:hypothetical protein